MTLEAEIERRRRNNRWVTAPLSWRARIAAAWSVLFRSPHGHTPIAVWDTFGGQRVVAMLDGNGKHAATAILADHEAFDIAYHLTPELGTRHRRMCEARDALYALSYPRSRAEQLREVADEFDCGGGCEGCGDSEKFCRHAASNDLRTLAQALDLKDQIDTAQRDVVV